MSARPGSGEDRVRSALRAAEVPGAEEAERRALALVLAAAPHRGAEDAGRAPGVRSRGGRRRFLQVAVVVGLLAAIVSPAGAAVRDWVKDAVDEQAPPALPALTSLPTEGSLLVDSPGGPWTVHADGSKRLLGGYTSAGWSPHGWFVAATSRHQLAALEPDGDVRWTLGRDGPVSDPAWSPDGFRIAYLDGRDLRMVVGDGDGDRLLAGRVLPVAPAWRPNGARVLSFVDGDGSVRTIRADSGDLLFSVPAPEGGVGAAPGSPAGSTISSLSWAADGSRLLIARESSVEAFGPDGRLAWRAEAPAGAEIADAAIATGGAYAAAVLRFPSESRSALRLLGPGGDGRRLFEGLGRFGQVELSPDGAWLLLTWPSADQWLFLNPRRPGMTVAIADIAAQFSPGATSPSAFPRVAGWCCSARP